MITLLTTLICAVVILLAQGYWLNPYFDLSNVMTMEYLQSLA